MNQRTPIPADALAQLPAQTRFLVEALRLPRRTRVMDVGANPANVPDYAPLRDAGLVEVLGFEPGPEAFARLEQMKQPNETYYPHAVGRGGAAVFHLTEGGSFASLYPPSARQIETLGHWENALRVREKIALTTRALDEIEGLAPPDMLKMDTQGAELDILLGGAETLARTVAIVPEIRFFQLYDGEPMFGALDTHLREMGFMLHKILPGANLSLVTSRAGKLRPAQMRNQMIDADAIYIRDIAHPERMDDTQLGHLALLADGVFHSTDLALRCLDLLVARGAFDDPDIDTYITKLPAAMRLPS